jgi:hypothetical protein
MKNFLFRAIFINLTFLLKYILNQNSYQCDIYRCSQFNLQDNQCVYIHPINANSTTQNIFDISLTCGVDKYCPPPAYTNQSCTVKPINNQLIDGDACRNNTNCASNICNNNKCHGVQAMGVCANNTMCATGLFCGKVATNSTTLNCILQKKVGESCETDFDCVNNAGCYKLNKTCVNYLSISDGTPIHDGGDLLCQNMKVVKGFCVSTLLNQHNDECVANNGTLQKQCVYNVTGFPANTSNTFSSNCQCSRAYSDKSFCEYDTVNSNWQKLINYLKDYFNGDAMKTHTSRRLNFNSNLNRLYTTVKNYPQYKDADDCAIGIDTNSSYLKYSLYFTILGLLILF